MCLIKMLPDVGMVKGYPKCFLKAANVHWVVTLTRNTPCSWTFSTSWFFHAATSGITDTVHHPYISTCFCGKHFYAPYSIEFTHVYIAILRVPFLRPDPTGHCAPKLPWRLGLKLVRQRLNIYKHNCKDISVTYR